MKRITNFIIVCILVIIIRPAFAIDQKADNEIPNVSEAGIPASETFLLDKEKQISDQKSETTEPLETSESSDVTVASEDSEQLDASGTLVISETSENSDDNDNIEEQTEEDQQQISQKDSKQKEEPKLQNNWLEKVSGKQLNILKSKLEALQNIYNVNFRAFRIVCAINNFEKADSQKKRNNANLLELTKQQPFTIYSTSYVFPELLKLNIEKFCSHLLDVEKTLTDEIKDTPEEIEKLIEDISKSVDDYLVVSDFYEKLALKAENELNQFIKFNSKINNLTQIGYYIKKTNHQIFEVIKKQIESMQDISAQLKLAIEYSKEQIQFMNSRNQSIPLKGKYIAEIRSSFKDFEIFIGSYENKQEYNFYLFSNSFSTRFDEVEKLIGKEEIREGRIKNYIKKSDFTLQSKAIKDYKAKEDLEKAFEMFGLTEIDNELYEQLLVFVDGECWQSRYEEPKGESDKSDKEPTTLQKGQKPKLIDFEDE